MRKTAVALVIGLVLLIVASARAQTPAPSPPGTTRLAWDHDGLNVATWELVIDANAPVTVTPTALAPGQWAIPFPALTPGAHTLVVRACNVAGCTASDPFAVTVVATPNPFPGGGNLRIVPG
jgi:hypothetical protein